MSLYDPPITLEDEEVERLRLSHAALEARAAASAQGERAAQCLARAAAETVEVLETNMSSLFTTAKLELLRKDGELDRLRSLLDRERAALALTQSAMHTHLAAQDRACAVLRAALELAGVLPPLTGSSSSSSSSVPTAPSPLADAALQWEALVTGAVQKWGSQPALAPPLQPQPAPPPQLPPPPPQQQQQRQERGEGREEAWYGGARGGERDWRQERDARGSEGRSGRQDREGSAWPAREHGEQRRSRSREREGRGREDRGGERRHRRSRSRSGSRRSRERRHDSGREREAPGGYHHAQHQHHQHQGSSHYGSGRR